MSECFPQPESVEGDMLRDLREAWSKGGSARLEIERPARPRPATGAPGRMGLRVFEGRIEQVAVTGAFAIVGGYHVPLDRVTEYQTYGYKKDGR